MRDYGTIKTAFWSHYKTASLSLPAQTVMTYLIAGPHSNGSGVYRLPLAYLQADFHLPVERMLTALGADHSAHTVIIEALAELQEARMVFYCTDTNFLLVRDFLEWNPVENTRVWVCRVKELEAVPKRFMYPQQLLHVLDFLEERSTEWKKETVRKFIAPQAPRIEALRKRFGNRKDTLSILCPTEPEPNPTRTEPNPTQPEPGNTSQSNGSTTADEATVFWWPLKGGGVYPVNGAKIAEWETAYPSIDVPAKLRVLYQWNVDNPTRQKTKAGVLRHISGALSKSNSEAEQNGKKLTGPITETGRNREAIKRARQNGNF